MWNGYRIKISSGTEVEINGKTYNKTPGIQKALTETSNKPLKKIKDKDREISNNIFESPNFENYKAIRGESKSGRYKISETISKKRNLEGQGIEKILYYRT